MFRVGEAEGLTEAAALVLHKDDAVLVLRRGLVPSEVTRLLDQLACEAGPNRPAVDASPNGLVFEISDEVRITWASPTVTSLLGYEPCEVVGKDPLDLVYCDAETMERVMRSRARTLTSRPGEVRDSIEVKLQRKDGNPLPFLWTTFRRCDGGFVTYGERCDDNVVPIHKPQLRLRRAVST